MDAVRHLEISCRRGVPYAAYFHLSSPPNRRSVRMELAEPQLVIDFDAEDRPLGIEILAPRATTLEAFNRVLTRLGFPAATAEELGPLWTQPSVNSQ